MCAGCNVLLFSGDMAQWIMEMTNIIGWKLQLKEWNFKVAAISLSCVFFLLCLSNKEFTDVTSVVNLWILM